MRPLVISVALLAIGACNAREKPNLFACQIPMDSMKRAVEAARTARDEGNPSEVLFQTSLAAMNQQVLRDKDCCRFSETCLAGVS